MKQYYLNND